MAHVYAFPQANIALFEARCKEKIQQFEDAGSDEEDIWDEKDVTFAPEAQRRPRSAKHAHLFIYLFMLGWHLSLGFYVLIFFFHIRYIFMMDEIER